VISVGTATGTLLLVVSGEASELDAGVEASEAGQTVVEMATDEVTTAVVWDSAGQSVTSAAHEVIVETTVE
jgi:hypothetical protein